MKSISRKYSEFFKKNCRKRYLILCGGRRSAKTYSTFSYLYALACLIPDLKIVVLTFSYGTLQATMEDFENALGLTVMKKKEGFRSILPNGSIFQFEHKDDAKKTLGTQCDYLFVNESCNLPESVFNGYSPGVRVQCIFNYNPTSNAWTDNLIDEDKSNFLRTTWKDNKYLTPQQRESFEEIKRRFENPQHSILDEFSYYVYYLGEQTRVSGLVFPRVERISISDYDLIPAEEFLGFDFGFSVNGDPSALVGVKIYESNIYAREYFCEQGLINDFDLYKKLNETVGMDSYIYFDYGGIGLSRAMDMIRDFDVPFRKCIKKEVIDNISEIISWNYICCCGDDLYKELTTIELNPETGKLKAPYGDHCTDALRYGFNSAKINNIC